MTALLAAPLPARAQQGPDWMRGLEELMSLEVTSVSRKEQRVADTSAAVYVLTREEIRRSGMRSVAELLRLVPGLSVAQIDANKWSVASRGLGGRQSNKLLVMVDGRSIYTQSFAGVLWDEVDVPVQAIERIEVIRGPGASIWGANAVNGVINIITRGPSVRRETSVAAGVGSADFGSVLHDGRLGDRVGYRLFAEINGIDQMDRALPGSVPDRPVQRRAGGSFRATLNGRDTVEGSLHTTDTESGAIETTISSLVPFVAAGTPFTVETETWSASTRWTRQLARRGRLQIEGFVDSARRDDQVEYSRKTVDLALQHRLGVRGHHDVIWGAGYRAANDSVVGTPYFSLTPEDYAHRLASAFVQDEIAVLGDRGRIVIGTKLEHRDILGWNAQPTARFGWRFTPRQSAWGAVSRVLRAPDRIERNLEVVRAGMTLPNGLTAITRLQGNPDIEAEALTAYEAGYRTSAGPSTTVDIAAFRNHYSNLQTAVRGPMTMTVDGAGTPYMLAITTFQNIWAATTTGGEAVVVHAPQSFWKATAAYSLFTIDPEFSVAPAAAFDQGASPRHQGQIRLSTSLPHAVELDGALFAVGGLRALNVPAYARLDTRLAWHPVRPLEISLVVQNALDKGHAEFDGFAAGVPRTIEVPRTAYAGVAWGF